ncbi:transporter [Salicibibacter halophilus]|uniref:Transporter n=1 Tax=Salicibibacter halophilus TaxID=2502791 RepID=A0A514LMR1_9BACI|nr:transporter [Salicibibacter halophilus]
MGGFFGPPGQPPTGTPTQPTQTGAPTAPPPGFTPPRPDGVATFAVDPGAIRGCLFRFTYVWLTNQQQFWFYPIFVGQTSVAGFRWTGFSWSYFGIDTRLIDSFQCF